MDPTDSRGMMISTLKYVDKQAPTVVNTTYVCNTQYTVAHAWYFDDGDDDDDDDDGGYDNDDGDDDYDDNGDDDDDDNGDDYGDDDDDDGCTRAGST